MCTLVPQSSLKECSMPELSVFCCCCCKNEAVHCKNTFEQKPIVPRSVMTLIAMIV